METVLGEEIQLIFRANRLPSVTWGIARDAKYYLGVYRETGLANELIGYTEIDNDQSPQWITHFKETFLEDGTQNIVVVVYDLVKGEDNTEDKDDDTNRKKVCEAKFLLKNLMKGRRFLSLPLVLPNGQSNANSGILEVRAEESIPSRDVLPMTMSWTYEIKAVFAFQPSLFFTISRINEDGSRTLVYRSNAVKAKEWAVQWPEMIIEIQKLCNVDDQRIIFFEVFNAADKQEPIAQLETCVMDILAASTLGQPFTLNERPPKDVRRSWTPTVLGNFTISTGTRNTAPTYHDFLKVLNASLLFAVDLTASNGDPDVPDTRHYINRDDPAQLNPYQRCISISGRILERFDYDKKYQVYGFGAKTRNPTSGKWLSSANHCIEITKPGEDADGIDGVLAHYQKTLPEVMLSGPTFFAPIIRQATQFALENAGENADRQNLKYTILTIVTDGNIVDMEDTKAAIVEASKAPLSIIIIGVGCDGIEDDGPTADFFSQMQILDSDGVLLSANGVEAERDIVQFVPFETTIAIGEDNFAQELQAEIPNQILQYFDRRGIVPDLSALVE